jgi:oligosaccharide repeat unit polymerase
VTADARLETSGGSYARPSAGTLLAMLGFAVTLLALLLLVALAPKDSLPPGTGVPLAIAVGLVLAAEAMVIRRHDVFEPMHLLSLCFAVLYIAHPMAIAARGTLDAYGQLGLDARPLLPRAIMLADLGFGSMVLGYVLTGRSGTTPRPARSWDGERLRRYRRRVGVVALLLSTAFLVSQGGDIAILHAGRTVAATKAFQQSSGYLYSAPLLFLPVGLSVLYRTTRWASWRGALGLFLVGLSQASTFGTGSRSYFLPAASSTLLVWFLARGRRPRAVILALLLFGALTVGITLPREARVVANQRVGAQVSTFDLAGGFREFASGQDTAMVDSFSLELDAVPREVPYQYGASYVGALARPVPRAVWRGKPGSGDELLNRQLFPSFASRRIGFAFGFFGEPYLNFGVLGVVLVSLLSGIALRRLYNYLRSRPRDELAVLVFALSWPFVFVYMRGSLGVDYQRQAILLLPLIWLYRRAEVRGDGGSTPVAFQRSGRARSRGAR